MRNIYPYLYAFFIGTLSLTGHAASLGVVGETFPVEEMSLLTLIESRVKALTDSGEMDAIQDRWVTQVGQQANRPMPIGLSRARMSHAYHYEPIVVLAQDILDATDHVVFSKGTRMNALEQLPTYKPNWLFFDADDGSQVQWAKAQLQRDHDATVILTGGSVFDMEHELNMAIYFDQAGRISSRLGLKHVPALVSREGNKLAIREVVIKESSHGK